MSTATMKHIMSILKKLKLTITWRKLTGLMKFTIPIKNMFICQCMNSMLMSNVTILLSILKLIMCTQSLRSITIRSMSSILIQNTGQSNSMWITCQLMLTRLTIQENSTTNNTTASITSFSDSFVCSQKPN